MILYRRKQLPAYLAELDLVRTGNHVVAANEDEFASIRPYTDGNLCISELDDAHEMTLAWEILPTKEIAERVERWQRRPNATISYTSYGWYWSDIVRFLRGHGSGNYKPVKECPGLDRANIRALAARVSIVDLLHCAAAAAIDPSQAPTKAEETTIKREEKRLFTLLKLAAKPQKPLSRETKARERREFTVSAGIKNRVLANHQSRCFYSGVTSLQTDLHIHHIIPVRVIELLRLSKVLFTAEFNLVPISADLNVVKSANLTAEDVALCLQRFAMPSHPNHGALKYLELIQQLQSFDPAPLAKT